MMAAPADVRAFVAANDLTSRSRWRASGRTALIAALYAGLVGIGYAADHWAVWILVWTVQGCILVGSYSAMHEAAHGTLYPGRGVNRVAGVLWASTILMNWSLWRSFHLEHHAHTGSDADPKLKHKRVITHPAGYVALPIGGLLFLAEFFAQSLVSLTGKMPDYVRSTERQAAIRRDAVVLLAVVAGIVAAAALAPGVLLRVWVFPLVATYCVVLPATGMSEHYGCATEGSPFETTRSVVSNRPFRFLVWNNNYHAVHHLVPAVPFHHAPELHAFIESRTVHLAPSYTAFHLGILGECRRGRRRVAAPT
jgi:fatty acid desaturase